MLILTRHVVESIIIPLDQITVKNGCIEIVVVEIRGDKVRLGFNADKSIAIHRKEVYETIQRQKVKP